MRPRPAPPPGQEPSQWHHRPLAPGELRRIPQLVRDTFALIGRRWRPFGEYVLIGAAGYIVAFVMLFLGLNALFGGQFFSKLEELTDPLGDTPVDFGAWLESFDVTPTALAIVLLIAFGLASSIGFLVQDIAITRMALDDVDGRELNFARTLSASFRRMPKIFAISLLLGFVMGLAGCGVCVFLAFIAPALAILWALAFVAAVWVFFPLIAIYFVMAYVEPRIPSPRRWWRLMRGRKAAIWGRVFLLSLVAGGVGYVVSLALSALPLPALYGDLIVNVVVTPLFFVVGAVAHLLIYADLITAEQQPTIDAESLS